MNIAELSPERKLDYIRDCVLAIREGQVDKKILCPYCGELNYSTNEFLCCTLFGEAMKAVLGRLEALDKIDFVSNVHDRLVN